MRAMQPAEPDVMPPDTGFVITCEHGGNDIPPAYGELFKPHRALLDTHRGYDPGALLAARELATAFDAPLVYATVSRLLVDLNRSVGNPTLFFEATGQGPAGLREEILHLHYRPYRTEVERVMQAAIAKHGRVLHISLHSFTPELNGDLRTADVGLLYDPRRPGEAALCARWQAALKRCAPQLTVRRNYPYQGKGDGFASWLRTQLEPDVYVGIELEINQKHVFAGGVPWITLRQQLVSSLREAFYNDPSSRNRAHGTISATA